LVLFDIDLMVDRASPLINGFDEEAAFAGLLDLCAEGIVLARRCHAIAAGKKDISDFAGRAQQASVLRFIGTTEQQRVVRENVRNKWLDVFVSDPNFKSEHVDIASHVYARIRFEAMNHSLTDALADPPLLQMLFKEHGAGFSIACDNSYIDNRKDDYLASCVEMGLTSAFAEKSWQVLRGESINPSVE
jgi:hypothetical protein